MPGVGCSFTHRERRGTALAAVVAMLLVGIPATNAESDESALVAQLAWSGTVGGRFSDYVSDLAVGPDGSSYVVGIGSGWSTTPSPAPFGNGFFAKYSPSGQLLIANSLPSGTGHASSVSLDPLGGVYVAGHASASTTFATPGAFQSTNAGHNDAFVMHLSEEGTVEWATYFGGSSWDEAWGLAVDEQGSAYVVGGTGSNNFPTKNAAQPTSGGDEDAWAAKFDRQGQLVYSTYIGGLEHEWAWEVALDGPRAIVLADAHATTPASKTIGPLGGQFDIGLFRLAPDGGSFERRVLIGGSNLDRADDIVLSPAGDLFIAGRTWSTDFPLAGTPTTPYAGGADAYVARVDLDGGTLERSVLYAPVASNDYFTLAVDAQERAWLAVTTEGLPPVSALMPSRVGLLDAGLVAFDGNLDVEFASHFGGLLDDQSRAIGVHPDGGVVLGGLTSSPDFPRLGSPQATYGGGYNDAFLLRVPLGCDVSPLPIPETRVDLAGSRGLAGWLLGNVEARLSVAPWCSYAATRVGLDGSTLVESLREPVLSEGVHVLSYQSVALDGRVEPLRTMEVKIDGTPPTLDLATVCSVPLVAGWCAGAVAGSRFASDAVSGVASVTCRLAGTSQPCDALGTPADGRHTLVVSAADVAGNVASGSAALDVDATPPRVTLALPALPEGGFYAEPIAVSATFTDATSGIASTSITLDGTAVAGSSFVVSLPGRHEIVAKATDRAGNVAEARRTILVDLGPPTTTLTLAGVAGEPGFWRSALVGTLATVDLDVAETRWSLDDGAWNTGTRFEVAAEGEHVIAFASTDTIGNVEPTQRARFTIDLTAPTSTLLAPPAAASGWITSATPFTLAAEDALAGVATTRISVGGRAFDAATFDLPDGDHAFAYWGVDRAGNEEAPRAARARMDRAAPVTFATIVGLAGENGWWRSAPTLTLAAADSTSGVARTLLSVNGGDPVDSVTTTFLDGEHVVRFWSVDHAGNAETPQVLEIRVDSAPPSTALTTPQPGVVYVNGAPALAGRAGEPLAASAPAPSANVATVVGRIRLEASAEDAVSDVARVEFRLDGALLGVARDAPWTLAWDATSAIAGGHRLEAVAFDAAGNAATAKVRVATAPGLLQ